MVNRLVASEFQIAGDRLIWPGGQLAVDDVLVMLEGSDEASRLIVTWAIVAAVMGVMFFVMLETQVNIWVGDLTYALGLDWNVAFGLSVEDVLLVLIPTFPAIIWGALRSRTLLGPWGHGVLKIATTNGAILRVPTTTKSEATLAINRIARDLSAYRAAQGLAGSNEFGAPAPQ